MRRVDMRPSEAPSTSGGAPGGGFPALEVRALSKSFGEHAAVVGVDLELQKHEVHVLLGENGAGKSTVLNMLYGHLTPDTGEIRVDGVTRALKTPAHALSVGIGMVHQHFTVVRSLTVAENVALGAGRIFRPGNLRRELAAVRATLERLGWDLDPDHRVGDLSIAQAQRVEILSLLHRGARILLLDEPTALLAPREIDSLLGTLDELRRSGTATLLVTHKLREIQTLADRVTVIRSGRVTAHLSADELDENVLTSAMTGRRYLTEVNVGNGAAAVGQPALRVQSLVVRDGDPEVSFQVRAGEIVAFAGVEGNGQEQLFEALSGQRTAAAGSIQLDGRDVTAETVAERRRGGLAVVPADRRSQGIVPSMTVAENVSLTDLMSGRGWSLDRSAMDSKARDLIETYDVRPPEPHALAGTLSGGNIQKLVVGRELSTEPQLLVVSSPTWGLDVGAVADIRAHLIAARNRGCMIVLFSPDLEEVLALADRLLVLFRGGVTLDVPRSAIDVGEVSRAMAGVLLAEPAHARPSDGSAS